MSGRLSGIALCVLALTTLAFTDSEAQQQRYGWRVSASPSNPCHHSGNFSPGGIATIFLWLYYGHPEGMSAADLSVVINPPGAVNVLAFNTANGFLNAGSASNLLLAVGGCPEGPVNAGSWLTIPAQSSWEFCLGGNLLTVNCEVNPTAYASDTHGYRNGSAPHTCAIGMSEICEPLSVESSSWGQVKSLYR